MNYVYPIPGSSTSNPNAFVADNTHVLGDLDKSVDSQPEVTVDYSQLTPAVTITGYSFRVSPGGEPQLWVDTTSNTTTMLSFFLRGGIAGVQYALKIVALLGDTEIRTDTLNVNLLGDNCGCQLFGSPPPAAGSSVSGDGSLIVNTAPRFFVSGTPPVGANVLDRWYNTTNGLTYDYVTNGVTSSWQVSSGGGGGGGGGISDVVAIAQIFPDGVTTTFTLATATGGAVNVTDPVNLFVSVDGVWQQSITQYNVSNGNLLTFASAPSADSNVFIVWFIPQLPQGGI
jgi:hypothetical protein